MSSSDTQASLRALRDLAREIRVRCDAIAMSVDAISSACDEAMLADTNDAIEDLAAYKMQPATGKASEDAECLRGDIRLLDMRLEDIWMSL